MIHGSHRGFASYRILCILDNIGSNKLTKIWRDYHLRKETKIRLHNTFAFPIATCGQWQF